MTLWTSLEPASATVVPGDSTSVRLRVRNTGDIVDEYHFEPVGDLAPWTRVEPQSLRLYPGTTGTVELTFAPPRTPDATAGPNPYAVRITPTEHPEAVTVPEGNLTISPFTEVRTELVPPTVKGRFRGRPKLAVDNLGNTKITASLSGSDTGEKLSYDLQPSNIQVEPGRAAFVKTTLRPRQIIWFGSKQEQPYALALRRSGAEPVDTNGTYVQRGFLPRWLASTLGLLLMLTIAFVVIWLAYKPQVRTAANEKPEKAGQLAPPSSSPPISSPPPEPEKKDEDEEKGAGADGEDKGGGGGGGGEEKKKEKPKERTAATVVRERAAKDEGGRHICYRVYVEDHWRPVVCDGTEAGTGGPGPDQFKPIKAINFAVSGTDGVTGNGAHVTNGYITGDKWAKAPDKKDMVVGSTQPDVRPLQGFTIGVKKGVVCQATFVQDKEWMGLHCTKQDSWIYAGSPMNENHPLKRIRLTVRENPPQ